MSCNSHDKQQVEDSLTNEFIYNIDIFGSVDLVFNKVDTDYKYFPQKKNIFGKVKESYIASRTMWGTPVHKYSIEEFATNKETSRTSELIDGVVYLKPSVVIKTKRHKYITRFFDTKSDAKRFYDKLIGDLSSRGWRGLSF